MASPDAPPHGSVGGRPAGGLILGLAAYVCWGAMPLYFLLSTFYFLAMHPAGAPEIVAWRDRVLCPAVDLAEPRRLAPSFGAYGLVKKRVSGTVDPLSGLTLETAWLVPVAVVQLIVVGSTSGLAFGTAGLATSLVLASAGVGTAVLVVAEGSIAGSRRRSRES